MAQRDDTPILVPMEPDDFWAQIRGIIREEIGSLEQKSEARQEVVGIKQKPFYDMSEVRVLFNKISRTTVYEWIKDGKLKPKKMKGKLYFLWCDIEKMMGSE